MTKGKLEICCGDIHSVLAAVEGGADRIELCSALAEGGVTPSAGMIEAAMAMRKSAAIHVLIRPREGDFIYTPEEVSVMAADIAAARKAGAQGVVIGALHADGTIDTDACRRLADAAGDMSITFHRSFDMTSDPFEALESIISLGCDRILTSGCASTALEGASMLCRLRQAADGRIILLGGCGVGPDNAAEILRLTGLRELHASARSVTRSRMTFRNTGVAMGAPGKDEYTRLTTDADKVRKLATILHNII